LRAKFVPYEQPRELSRRSLPRTGQHQGGRNARVRGESLLEDGLAASAAWHRERRESLEVAFG
jgi:hypothetical protein